MKIVNNLMNIRNTNEIYRIIASYVVSNVMPVLDDDAREIMVSLGERAGVIAGDIYFTHYTYPLINQNENEDKILEALRQALIKYVGTEKYEEIHRITEYDNVLSEVYARSFLESFINELKDLIDKQQKQSQSKGNDNNNNNGSGGQDGVSESTSILDNVDQGMIENAFAKALQKSEDFVKSFDDLRSVTGGGVGKERGGFERLYDLTRSILNVELYRDIITLGRKSMRNIMFSKIMKERGKHGDISGYMMTRRVDRAHPREMALPDDLFMYKLVSGFIAREHSVIKEGAYYILLDKSGSMMGDKTVWSRSVALAFLKLSSVRKREFMLRFFDTTTYPPPHTPPLTNKDSTSRIDLIERLLTTESSGGTSIDNALITALVDLEKLKDKTNTIIIITDGEDDVKTKKEELKKRNANLISIMISGENNTLKELSTVYLKAELVGKDTLKLIDKVKKI